MTDWKANYTHQLKLFNPQRACPIVGFGAGAVGSWAAFFLAKEGFTDITWWDDDVIKSHNIPMSLYGPADVGKHKVECLQQRIEELTGVVIKPVRKKFTSPKSATLSRCIVVCCVDEMEKGRMPLWAAVKKNPTIKLFCDSRVAAAYTEVISVVPYEPKDIFRYEALLFTDKKAARQMCGEHGIVYGSVNAARVIASNASRILMAGMVPWRYAERCDTLERAH